MGAISQHPKGDDVVQKKSFIVIHHFLLDRLTLLTARAQVLYLQLRRFSNSDYKPVYPSLQKLASLMKVSTDTITRAIKELEHFQLIRVERNLQGNRNRYHFITESNEIPFPQQPVEEDCAGFSVSAPASVFISTPVSEPLNHPTPQPVEDTTHKFAASTNKNSRTRINPSTDHPTMNKTMQEPLRVVGITKSATPEKQHEPEPSNDIPPALSQVVAQFEVVQKALHRSPPQPDYSLITPSMFQACGIDPQSTAAPFLTGYLNWFFKQPSLCQNITNKAGFIKWLLRHLDRYSFAPYLHFLRGILKQKRVEEKALKDRETEAMQAEQAEQLKKQQDQRIADFQSTHPDLVAAWQAEAEQDQRNHPLFNQPESMFYKIGVRKTLLDRIDGWKG